MREVAAEELGKLREHVFLSDGTQYPKVREEKQKEILVSFEFKNGTCIHGWLERTSVIAELSEAAGQAFSSQQTILFAEFTNGYLCILEGGTGYAPEANFFMQKEEVATLLNRMTLVANTKEEV